MTAILHPSSLLFHLGLDLHQRWHYQAMDVFSCRAGAEHHTTGRNFRDCLVEHCQGVAREIRRLCRAADFFLEISQERVTNVEPNFHGPLQKIP